MFGFGDAYNTDPTYFEVNDDCTPKIEDGGLLLHNASWMNGPWINHMLMGIDEGPLVLALENYRSGLVWNLANENVNILAGLYTIFVPDEFNNIVTGPGPGPRNPPLVRTPYASWITYNVPRFGVNVACGNIDGDGFDEIITGPGPAIEFGPHVRAWKADRAPVVGVNFLAYGTHRYGVNVAAGDIDGDGIDEIVTGAGPGAVFGPHVRGWNVDGGTAGPIPGVSFLAYGTHKWGVNVACGDVDGDGFAEIVTGAGPGAVFGPHVRAWNFDGSGNTASIPAVSFMAYGTHKYGVNVACGDLDGDGFDEIITGPGPGSSFAAHIRGWNYDGEEVNPMAGVNFVAYPSARYGANVSAADTDEDSIDEILTMPGPDFSQQAHVRIWSADGGGSVLIEEFIAYEEWMTYGGKIAGGKLSPRQNIVQ